MGGGDVRKLPERFNRAGKTNPECEHHGVGSWAEFKKKEEREKAS